MGGERTFSVLDNYGQGNCLLYCYILCELYHTGQEPGGLRHMNAIAKQYRKDMLSRVEKFDFCADKSSGKKSDLDIAREEFRTDKTWISTFMIPFLNRYSGYGVILITSRRSSITGKYERSLIYEENPTSTTVIVIHYQDGHYTIIKPSNSDCPSIEEGDEDFEYIMSCGEKRDFSFIPK